MTNDLYFEWLKNQIDIPEIHSYESLLELLNTQEFTWKSTCPMDENRATDGLTLRYLFGYETGEDESLIKGPCSILEMLVALAIRCENDIMGTAEDGDSAWEWFWLMIHNLGLLNMTDTNYDEDYILSCLKVFLERTYSASGVGGLFPMRCPKEDLRNVEIWYQMSWYLEENDM